MKKRFTIMLNVKTITKLKEASLTMKPKDFREQLEIVLKDSAEMLLKGWRVENDK